MSAHGAPARRLAAGRGGVEVALGAGLLLLSLLLALRELGWWFSDAIVWPVVLVAAGGGAALAPVGGHERAGGAGRRPVSP